MLLLPQILMGCGLWDSHPSLTFLDLKNGGYSPLFSVQKNVWEIDLKNLIWKGPFIFSFGKSLLHVSVSLEWVPWLYLLFTILSKKPKMLFRPRRRSAEMPSTPGHFSGLNVSTAHLTLTSQHISFPTLSFSF